VSAEPSSQGKPFPAFTLRPALADGLAVAVLGISGVLAPISGLLGLLGLWGIPRSLAALVTVYGLASLWCAWRLFASTSHGWPYYALGSVLLLTGSPLDSALESHRAQWPRLGQYVVVVLWGIARWYSYRRQHLRLGRPGRVLRVGP
jgi:hypothetical protein